MTLRLHRRCIALPCLWLAVGACSTPSTPKPSLATHGKTSSNGDERQLRLLLDDGRPLANTTLRLRCGDRALQRRTGKRGELSLPARPCELWLGPRWLALQSGASEVNLPPELVVELSWSRGGDKGTLALDSRVHAVHPYELAPFRLSLSGGRLSYQSRGRAKTVLAREGLVLSLPPLGPASTPTRASLLAKLPKLIVEPHLATRHRALRAAWLRSRLPALMAEAFSPKVRRKGRGAKSDRKFHALLNKGRRLPAKQAEQVYLRARRFAELAYDRGSRRRLLPEILLLSSRIGRLLEDCGIHGGKRPRRSPCWAQSSSFIDLSKARLGRTSRPWPLFSEWKAIEGSNTDLGSIWGVRAMLMASGARLSLLPVAASDRWRRRYARLLRSQSDELYQLAVRWRRSISVHRKRYTKGAAASFLGYAHRQHLGLARAPSLKPRPALRVEKVRRRSAVPPALRRRARGHEAASTPLSTSAGLAPLRSLLGRQRTLLLLTACPRGRKWIAAATNLSQRYGWVGLRVGAVMSKPCNDALGHQRSRGLWRAGPTLAWALAVRAPAAVILDSRGAILWRQQLRSLGEGVDAATAWMEQNWTSFAAARKTGPPAPAAALVKKLTALESAVRTHILAKRGSKALALAKKALALAPQRSEQQRLVALAAGHARDVGEVVARSAWWRRRYGDLAAEALLDDVRKETGVPELDDPGRRTP